MLYMTFLNAILVLLTVVRTNIANDSCTALYCACAYAHRAQYLYYDLHILLGSEVRIIKVGLYMVCNVRIAVGHSIRSPDSNHSFN